MNSLNLIAWNTARPYTKNGQRIAAAEIAGGVFMKDIDRNLEYFFEDCAFNRVAILNAYDDGAFSHKPLPREIMNYGFYDLCRLLEAEANKLPSA